MYRLIALLFSIGLLAAHPATAVLDMDADKDESISREEYLSVVAKLFIAADTNFDGYLEGDEILVVQNYCRDADSVHRFGFADTNDDGALSVAEMLAASDHRAKQSAERNLIKNMRFDLNSDGRMDAEETLLKRETLRKEIQELRRKAEASRKTSKSETPKPTDTPFAPVMTFQGLINPRSRPHFDTDEDQRLTLMEYRIGMGARFDEKDLDGDGTLVGDEIPTTVLFSR